MPLFRALAKNMAPMTNADESPTNRLTLFPIYLSLFIVSTLCPLTPVTFFSRCRHKRCRKWLMVDQDRPEVVLLIILQNGILQNL